MKVLAVVALCLAAALSVEGQVCSTVCGGICTVTKQACSLAVVVGPVCDLMGTVCTQTCELGCKCPDECNAECQPNYDACVSENAGNVVGLSECTVNFNFCATFCSDKCVDGVSQSVAGQLQAAAASAFGQ